MPMMSRMSVQTVGESHAFCLQKTALTEEPGQALAVPKSLAGVHVTNVERRIQLSHPSVGRGHLSQPREVISFPLSSVETSNRVDVTTDLSPQFPFSGCLHMLLESCGRAWGDGSMPTVLRA